MQRKSECKEKTESKNKYFGTDEDTLRDLKAAFGFFDEETDAAGKTSKKDESKKEKDIAENKYGFGTVEDADREAYEALGITPEDAENEELTFTNEFGDTTDEEIERLKSELKKELGKLSANPMFNPKIYTLALQLGGKYIQKGYRTFKKWLSKMTDDIGEEFKPQKNQKQTLQHI